MECMRALLNSRCLEGPTCVDSLCYLLITPLSTVLPSRSLIPERILWAHLQVLLPSRLACLRTVLTPLPRLESRWLVARNPLRPLVSPFRTVISLPLSPLPLVDTVKVLLPWEPTLPLSVVSRVLPLDPLCCRPLITEARFPISCLVSCTLERRLESIPRRWLTPLLTAAYLLESTWWHLLAASRCVLALVMSWFSVTFYPAPILVKKLARSRPTSVSHLNPLPLVNTLPHVNPLLPTGRSA